MPKKGKKVTVNMGEGTTQSVNYLSNGISNLVTGALRTAFFFVTIPIDIARWQNGEIKGKDVFKNIGPVKVLQGVGRTALFAGSAAATVLPVPAKVRKGLLNLDDKGGRFDFIDHMKNDFDNPAIPYDKKAPTEGEPPPRRPPPPPTKGVPGKGEPPSQKPPSPPATGAAAATAANDESLGGIPKTAATATGPMLENLPFTGLRFHRILDDGHCLFNAVGIHVNQDAQFLRALVTAHMEENFEQLKEFYPGTDEEFTTHIAAIRNTNEWGGNLEIHVLQELLDRPIIIIRPDANPTIPDNLDELHGEPIFVYYNGHNHYDSFDVEDGYEARGILAEIQNAIGLRNCARDQPTEVKASSDEPKKGTSPASHSGPEESSKNIVRRDLITCIDAIAIFFKDHVGDLFRALNSFEGAIQDTSYIEVVQKAKKLSKLLDGIDINVAKEQIMSNLNDFLDAAIHTLSRFDCSPPAFQLYLDQQIQIKIMILQIQLISELYNPELRLSANLSGLKQKLEHMDGLPVYGADNIEHLVSEEQQAPAFRQPTTYTCSENSSGFFATSGSQDDDSDLESGLHLGDLQRRQ